MHVSVFNTGIIISSLLVILFFYDKLGNLMGFIGAGTGFFLIYLSPLAINIVYFLVKHPESSQQNLSADSEYVLGSLDDISKITSNKIPVEQPSVMEPLRDKIGVSEKPYSKPRNIAFIIMNVILMLFGLFTLIIQFVNINYFDVHIQDA